MKQKRHTTEEITRILLQAEGGTHVEAVCREHNVTTTSYPGDGGSERKMVNPAQKRRAVQGLVLTRLCSQRRACR
jgi:Transposase